MRIEETDRGSNSVWPAVPISTYRDGFGNRCNRVLAPAGRLRLMTDCVVRDSGQPDERVFGAVQDSVQHLPKDVLVFLLGSRVDSRIDLADEAWKVR
jgi:hypothetical protein